MTCWSTPLGPLNRRTDVKKNGVGVWVGNADRASGPIAKIIAAELRVAINQGRTEIGVELAKQLGNLGAITGTTISNCSFGE